MVNLLFLRHIVSNPLFIIESILHSIFRVRVCSSTTKQHTTKIKRLNMQFCIIEIKS